MCSHFVEERITLTIKMRIAGKTAPPKSAHCRVKTPN